MRRLSNTGFTALLARADVSQAGFSRLAGLTPRQVNNWCRGRAPAPVWAELAKVPSASADGMPAEGALLAVVLQDHSPEALEIRVEEAKRSLSAMATDRR